MNKVVYISFTRLSDRTSRDYYIDYLIENGLNVEYWDIVSLVFTENSEAGMITPPHLRILNTLGELEKMLILPENKDALYVMLISCGAYSTRIFRLLSKHNCRMYYIAVGARPVLERPKSWKILNHLSNPVRLLKIIFDIVKVNAYRRLGLIRPFDCIFAAGSVMMSNDQYAAKMVPINLIDYDHFTRVRAKPERIVTGRYAVYLDTYIPHHNDNVILGRPSVDPDNHYRLLNRFFSLLEMKYDIKVVIAAHPTADYSIAPPFEGREIYRLLTAELTRDADFVIVDCSTSISYAVLNFKPIVLFYTSEMLSLYKETIVRLTKSYSDYLELPILNIDEITSVDQVAIGDVNKELYDKYIYDFLTSPESENSTSQEIFLREILTILQMAPSPQNYEKN
jgi:hypothetical protein